MFFSFHILFKILFQAIKRNACICLFVHWFIYWLTIYVCIYLFIIIYLVGWFYVQLIIETLQSTEIYSHINMFKLSLLHGLIALNKIIWYHQFKNLIHCFNDLTLILSSGSSIHSIIWFGVSIWINYLLIWVMDSIIWFTDWINDICKSYIWK